MPYKAQLVARTFARYRYDMLGAGQLSHTFVYAIPVAGQPSQMRPPSPLRS